MTTEAVTETPKGRPNIAEVNRERANERAEKTAAIKEKVSHQFHALTKLVAELPLKADQDKLTTIVKKLDEFAHGKPVTE